MLIFSKVEKTALDTLLHENILTQKNVKDTLKKLKQKVENNFPQLRNILYPLFEGQGVKAINLLS